MKTVPQNEENSKNAGKGVLAHGRQRCTACNAAPPATPHHLLNPKWLTGSGNMSTPMLLDPLNNFC